MALAAALVAVSPARPMWVRSGADEKSVARGSWAYGAIRTVTSHGLMGGSTLTFRPDASLTRSALARLAAGLAGRQYRALAGPDAPVTVAQLDRQLVRAVGMGGVASAFTRVVQATGLHPPLRFGSEVTARLIGLRFNHPTAFDRLELLPGAAATRAEAAYSAWRVLTLDRDAVTSAALSAEVPDLPVLTTWQRRILDIAIHFIGYPYVWGGTSEVPEGSLRSGGFDCSGFVWRVYKLQRYPGERKLSDVLRGRTTYEMSGEVPRSRRIPFSKLQPADVLFFGDAGPRSRPSQVGHMGIYLGAGWMIQSSSEGVALAPLEGWYRERFAWARRPLAEAGLAT
jgi:cell wall-associated NlpC family hydrolase